MFYRSMTVAAIMLAATPAIATAQGTAPRPGAPAAGATAPIRANVVRNLDANFKAIDTNGDGTLSPAELGAAEVKAQAVRNSNIRKQGETRFTQLDTNKDGQLSKAEFLVALPTRQVAASNGQNLMVPLDKNKDGKVSLDEYRLPVLGRFDQMDSNKDGQISQAERQAATQTASRR